MSSVPLLSEEEVVWNILILTVRFNQIDQSQIQKDDIYSSTLL